MRENDLTIVEKFLDSKEQTIDVREEPFEKIMFFYKSALTQLTTQMNIIKDEFKILYNYDLIDPYHQKEAEKHLQIYIYQTFLILIKF